MTQAQDANHISDADNLFSVRDKVVIVTGANRGMGRAMAEGFLARGAHVAFVARSPDIHDQVAGYGNDKATVVECELADRDAVERVVPQVVKRSGTVDVLVNCAGATPTDQYSDEGWAQTLAVNLHAVFYLSTAAAQVMKDHGGGAIINVTSLAAEQGFPLNTGYCAAKGGVRQLTRALARDYGQYNVRVNNLGPGYIRTDMTARSYGNDQVRAERTKRMMLGRWGQPQDMVGPCIFLASAASGYITATDLYVDGGWLSTGV